MFGSLPFAMARALVGFSRTVRQHPLTRDRPAAAFFRFLRWQFVSRVAPGPIIVPFAGAARIILGRTLTAATGNYYFGLFEFADMAFTAHLLRPGDIFVDVGSNIGAYTILAGTAGASVTAYEPGPAAFAVLRDNVALNGLSARLRPCGVGAAAGTVTFTRDEGAMNHVARAGEPGMAVPIVCLDDEALGAVTAIKIDVEGFEVPVLRGAARLLAQPSLLAIVIEMNGWSARYGFNESEIIDVMAVNGFAPCSYDPHKRVLSELDATALRKPDPERANVIFLRDRENVVQRLRTADHLVVLGQRV